MPIYNDNSPVIPLPPTLPSETPIPIIDTASSYSSFQYQGALITQLDGTPWQCTYFNQYLGKDDPIINSNDVQDPTLKQYLKIENFELRATSSLESNLDTSLGISVVTGESNVYPVITPQAGDIFFAIIQGNTYGVFEVTAVSRASQFKESVWSITYNQISYLNPDKQAYYEQYVVNRLIFDVSLLDYNTNPLKTESEYNQYTTKNQIILDLIQEYYLQFFDYYSSTFILPENIKSPALTYDPFIVKFFNSFVKTEWLQGLNFPIEYDLKCSFLYQPFSTVFDAITKQSNAVLKHAVKQMTTLSSNSFSAPFQRHNLQVSPIDYVIYPNVSGGIADNTYPDLTVSEALVEEVSAIQSMLSDSILNDQLNTAFQNAAITAAKIDALTISMQIMAAYQAYLTNDTVTLNTTLDNIKNLVNNYQVPTSTPLTNVSQLVDTSTVSYIFSSNFYNGLSGQSPIEFNVSNVINKLPILLSDILPIATSLDSLNPMDRFYQIPIIIALLTIAR